MENLTLFIVALSMILLVPGPDMILLLQTGARHGRGKALATALGLAVARGCHVALAALGLATLFKVSPWTFDAVRIIGAAYLLWLGLKMFKPGAMSAPQSGNAGDGAISWSTAILRGLLTNLLNPKALLFCSILLPQFINPGAGPVAGQFAELGVILVLIGLSFDSVYAMAGGWIGRWLARSATAQRVQQWLFGTLLIGFAVRLAFIQQA
ncbi:lysine transporter LysE [Pseudomonas sp. Bc-h]|uniref:LysE family translocator n=1 Tax=Pseudomonas sp. Bc-h TaxID=1943632 RepID=UPI0009D997C6|nr:LysE family translocator [Pseudomonas sp. Bc-h]OQR35557.1 lysine transporter LysE [Pseudomonas sp. Bc-h]